ncbi:hypothetical protein Tco_1346758 [Tanacetum coccineum]
MDSVSVAVTPHELPKKEDKVGHLGDSSGLKIDKIQKRRHVNYADPKITSGVLYCNRSVWELLVAYMWV